MVIFNLELDYYGRPSIFLTSYLGNVGSLNRMLGSYDGIQHINTAVKKQGNHTALHFACYGKSNVETVKSLINKGADCFVKDVVGRTPFHIACNSADPRIINYFLKQVSGIEALIAMPDNYGRTPLHALCCPGSSVAEKKRGEKLIVALNMLLDSFECDKDAVNALNQKDQFGLTPLMLAKFYNFDELYSIFAQLGIDVCKIPSVSTNNHGIIFDYFGRTKLMEAAFDGKLQMVKAELANHSYYDDPTLANEQAGFRSPLLLACCSGKDSIKDVVAAILNDERTNPLIVDIDNSNALHFATNTGRNDVVKLLLDNDQIRNNINALDCYGMTALHTLALSVARPTMRIKCVNLLLEHGIDLFAEDNAGRTAYDIAVAVGNNIVAHALFEAMCTCHDDDYYNSGRPNGGMAPRLIALERHVHKHNGKIFPDSTAPKLLLLKTSTYQYDEEGPVVSSSLRFIMGPC